MPPGFTDALEGEIDTDTEGAGDGEGLLLALPAGRTTKAPNSAEVCDGVEPLIICETAERFIGIVTGLPL